MNTVPNEGYFSWLVSLTEMPPTQNPHRSYWTLLHQMHVTPWRWFIHNDDNRGEDGKELRDEWLDEYGIGRDDFDGLDLDASVLEVLIALSRRVAFDDSGRPADWFWKLLENLDMQHYTDANYHEGVEADVDEGLRVLMDRTYSPDGRGGLFPLRNPTADQRRIEIRYQMAAYLLEGEFVANGP